jgi:hypothetical protein
MKGHIGEFENLVLLTFINLDKAYGVAEGKAEPDSINSSAMTSRIVRNQDSL